MPRLTTISSQSILGIAGGIVFNPRLKHTLNNPNSFSSAAEDYFGADIAMNDDYLLINASQEDTFGGSNAGRVYVFSPSTGELLHDLNNPNIYGGGFGDYFGGFGGYGYHGISISGSTAVIGASGEDSDGTNSGVAYVYDLSDSNPNLNNRATISNPNAQSTTQDDYFGRHVAVSENYILVTSQNEEDSDLVNFSGYAYIFRKSDNALLHSIRNPNSQSTSASDNFGLGAEINDTYTVIGAPNEYDSDGLYSSSGVVYVYSTPTGNLLYKLENPEPQQNNQFGGRLAISENHIIVGNYAYDEGLSGNSGNVYIFDISTGSLLHTISNPNAYSSVINDNFGSDVSIASKYAIAGAPGEDFVSNGVSTSNVGVAYIIDIQTGEMVKKIDNPSVEANAEFGYAVSITDNFAVVGARRADDANVGGKAYIYSLYDY